MDYYEMNDIPLSYEVETLTFVKVPTLTIMEYLKLNGYKNYLVKEHFPKEKHTEQDKINMKRMTEINERVTLTLNNKTYYK